MTNYLYQTDLPDDVELGSIVAIDTETMGLNPQRDRLCLVQLSSGDGNAHLIQIKQGEHNAPNLCKILADDNVLKLFHYGRFDIAVLLNHFNVLARTVYCTKIASKLVRTFTDRHGLKNILSELLSIDISKAQQSTDWGSPLLSEDQISYAASDVLYLHSAREELNIRLDREQRTELAQKCFMFLPYRAQLDLEGWPESDIFAHS